MKVITIPISSFDKLTVWFFDAMVDLGQAGFRIAVIVLAGAVGIRFLRVGLAHLEAILIKAGEAKETVPGATRKRVATLMGLLTTMSETLVWGIVVIIALDQLGLDIRPILAGAGILGLAVGFGAQNLVRDLISGFFIILENQVRVGDVAVVNGTGGLVEAITFRTITLRDLAGVVHIFPNGTITALSNMTKGWSGYILDIGVAYKEDTDYVVAVMREVAEELRREPGFSGKILEPIEIFGVDDFGDSAVVIKARLKTRPIEQWTVGREYRRRLKKTFDARGIEIPFPCRSLYLGDATSRLAAQMLGTAELRPDTTGSPSGARREERQ